MGACAGEMGDGGGAAAGLLLFVASRDGGVSGAAGVPVPSVLSVLLLSFLAPNSVARDAGEGTLVLPWNVMRPPDRS